MKILEITPIVVSSGENPRSATGFGPNWTFVKIATDEGLVGYGESFVTGRSDALVTLIGEMGQGLIGQDSSRILRLWTQIYRGARYPLGVDGMAVLSAIELALWDLAGKRAGLPVHRLVGGRTRDWVEVYASGIYINGANDLEEGVQSAREHGFRAIKFNPHPKESDATIQEWRSSLLERVERVRSAAGDETGVALDYHGRDLSPSSAMGLLRDLEPYRLLFLEEPALSNNVGSLLRVRNASRIPIAAGERCISRESAREVIEKEAVDYFQPEITACGGFSEVLLMARWAELHHIAIWPHHAGSFLSLVIGAQVAAATTNFGMMECNIRIDHSRAQELFPGFSGPENGRLSIPDTPGWGLDLDEEAAKRYPAKPFTRASHWSADGSVSYK